MLKSLALVCFAPLLLGASLGCSRRDASAEQHHVRVLVTNVPGEPLRGVPIKLGAQRLAVTGTDGYANLTIIGREGARANLDLECPANHRQPKEPVQVALFDYASGTVPEILAQCEQERVRLGVVVRSLGAKNIPLSLRGQPVGETDSSGIAHVLVEGDPGEAVDLVFDTSATPDLQPANPSVRLLLANHDDAALAEQRFEVKRDAAPRRRRAPAVRQAPIAHEGPVRIH